MPIREASKPQLVFVGCPWTKIRPKYERIFNKRTFKRRSPLSFVIVGRDGNQQAEDLYQEIKRRINMSSRAVFDVSGGNPNVALEFGYAEGLNIPCYVFVYEHGRFQRRQRTKGIIISDLSGTRRNPYKNERSLQRALIQFSDGHPYTRRVQAIVRRRRLNLKEQAGLMAIPRGFRDQDRIRRANLVQLIVDDTGVSEEYADRAIKVARKGKLIRVSRGQHGYTTLRP